MDDPGKWRIDLRRWEIFVTTMDLALRLGKLFMDCLTNWPF